MKNLEGPPWKNILCPIDFSDRSSHALETALYIARRDGAVLSLVHVMAPVPAPIIAASPAALPAVANMADVAELRTKLQREYQEQLDAVVREADTSDLEIRKEILEGRPADELADYAEAQGVDLIVMASMGHGRWRRFLFGSVAERLLKLSQCAVLILPLE